MCKNTKRRKAVAHYRKGEELRRWEHKTDGEAVDGIEEVDCGQIMDGLTNRLKNTSSLFESKQEPL